MVKVVVATPYPRSQMLLERYVGGCLKGIASVRATSTDSVDGSECDIIVVYQRGPNETIFRQRFPDVRVIGISFEIQACGVRQLAALPRGMTLGVVAGHRTCANMFLREILDSGIYQPRFLTGAFGDMPSMTVDAFAVAEEMEETLRAVYPVDKDKLLVLPRSLSNPSVVELISAASEASKAKQQ
ncbi:MAG: hypothetical protein HPY55_06945 [Firmicutes bacterium]|nr:hypothetical protein [Bacillota bacterium]